MDCPNCPTPFTRASRDVNEETVTFCLDFEDIQFGRRDILITLGRESVRRWMNGDFHFFEVPKAVAVEAGLDALLRYKIVQKPA